LASLLLRAAFGESCRAPAWLWIGAPAVVPGVAAVALAIAVKQNADELE
jgi:hypothetical protein